MTREQLEQLDRAAESRAPTVKLGTQYRDWRIDAKGVDIEARTIPVSFSSEAPVERWWGMEVLGHRAGEIDLTRVKQGLPVLDEHRNQIGIDDHVTFDADGKGRGLVRLGVGEVEDRTLQNAAAGIRRFLSVGYKVNRLREIEAPKSEGHKDGDLVMGWDGPQSPRDGRAKRWFRAINWTPAEHSFVSVAADVTVGVGRKEDRGMNDVAVEWLESRADDAGATDAPDTSGGESEMKRGMHAPEPHREADTGKEGAGGGAPTVEIVREDPKVAEQRGVDAERTRIGEITAIGARHNPELVERAVSEGWSVKKMNHEVLAAMPTPEAAAQVAGRQAPAEIGMSEKECDEYSISRGLLAIADGRWRTEGGLEKDASDAVAKQYGRTAGGMFLPYDKMVRGLLTERGLQLDKRAELTTTTGTGLVGTITMADAFIDVLRARTQVAAMGATILPGLRSSISLPRLATASTSGWVAESAGSGGSSMTFDALAMAPNTVRARQDITRRLLLQSTPMVDAIIMRDLGLTLGIAIDAAALVGTGGDTPTGITQTGSIGDVAIGTNGGAPAWAHLVELETDVATANADLGALGYLVSPMGRGKLKTTGRKDTGDTTSLGFVWQDDNTINGYRALASTNVPDTLTKGTLVAAASAVFFGNWQDLVIALWGTLDLKPDPYSSGDDDTLIVRAFQDADVGLRHPESFSCILDADMST